MHGLTMFHLSQEHLLEYPILWTASVQEHSPDHERDKHEHNQHSSSKQAIQVPHAIEPHGKQTA